MLACNQAKVKQYLDVTVGYALKNAYNRAQWQIGSYYEG